MTDSSAPNRSDSRSAEEEIHPRKSPHHHHETHGTSIDIDEDTPIDKVKAPNLFERMKEEAEAIIGAITPEKGHSENRPRGGEKIEGHKKSPLSSPRHHQHRHETHGTSGDIDEYTSISEVKGPNVFERMKEEVEAIVEAIHPPKKDSNGHNK